MKPETIKKLSIIDVSIPDPELSGAIDAAIKSHTDRSAFIGGPTLSQFTKNFAAFCQTPFAAGTANGTDSLILALRALGLKEGDEVITVPFTFIATAEAITVAGGKIKFVDIDPKTYTLDPHQLKRAVGPRTKAIIPVHIFGQSCDMDPILDFAKEHKLKVVEDAAQAHGAEYKGRRVGSMGDIGCFSFYPTKNLGGFGDGGAVTSQSESLIKKIEQIGNHGRAEQYFHVIEGINSRLDTIQAAVLDLKLKHLDKWNNRRLKIAEAYSKALIGNNYLTAPFVADYAKHVFHLYSIQTSYRDELADYLKQLGISTAVYYPLPLHLQPAYTYLDYKRGDFPVSEHVSSRIISLPMHPNLSDSDVNYIAGAIKEFVPPETR